MPGGGGGDTTSTVHQSNLPEYARPYYESLMNRAHAESTRPYQPYDDQRLAGQSQATTQGLQMANQFATSGSGDLDSARQLSGIVGQQALGMSGYQAGGVNNTYLGPNNYATGQFNTGYGGPQNYGAGQFDNTYTQAVGGNYQAGNFNAQQLGFGGSGPNQISTQDFGAAQASQYMSPFMEDVIGISQRESMQNAMQEEVMRDQQAAAAGAFGGSRAAVQQQMARNDAQQRISDIGIQGRQMSFENAQQQFERDRQARFGADVNNQQTALQMGLANQGANLQAQQMGEQSRQYGFGANQDAASRIAELNLMAQQQREQSRQFGAGLTEEGRQFASTQGLNAQQLGEQSRQFGYQQMDQGRQRAAELGMQAQSQTEQLRQSGADLGLRGLGLASDQAGMLAQMQQQRDQMMLQRIQAQLGIGQTQEDYRQEQLDMAYGDFVNQRDAQRQNLQFYSSLLQGVPVSANQNVTTTSPSNNLAGAAGTLTGLQALYALGRT